MAVFFEPQRRKGILGHKGTKLQRDAKGISGKFFVSQSHTNFEHRVTGSKKKAVIHCEILRETL